MISMHIEILIKYCEHFSAYYNSLNQDDKDILSNVANDIDISTINRDSQLFKEHAQCSLYLKKNSLIIPSIDFKYSSIPSNWGSYIKNEKLKEDVKARSHDIIHHWQDTLAKHIYVTRIYGGLKPSHSLDLKYRQLKQSGGSVNRSLFDTRDVVRFRVVCDDICSLFFAALKFFHSFTNKILYSHNYYFHSNTNGSGRPYRGIHIQVLLHSIYPIEIQFITKARDIAGAFDYPFLFKERISFINKQHERWLTEFRLKANIYDAINMKARLQREKLLELFFLA